MAAATDPATRKAGADALAATMALTPAARAKVAAWSAAADPRVSAQAMYEDLTTDLRAQLPAIRTPITLVYPWNTAMPTRPMADALYRAEYAGAPHIAFVDIGPAAHFVMLDQPQAFAAALADFAK
jgi:pimeloyl-ACP methyl ester carboxylesterase